MFKKIVVGYDRTERGQDALALGRLISRITEGRVVLAHVLTDDFAPDLDWQESQRSFTQAVQDELDTVAAAEKAPTEARVVASSSPAHGLYDLAEAEQADLVVVGSTHRGPVGRVIVGSVPERLLHGAPCAVAVAPRGYADRGDGKLATIGVAFDGSPDSKAAARLAAELASVNGSAVQLLAVALFGVSGAPVAYQQEHVERSERDRLEQQIAGAVQELRGVKVEGEVLEGEIAQTIAKRAEKGIDLLVAGSRGYGPVRRALLGSVSTQLARSAPCPLMVVPRTDQ